MCTVTAYFATYYLFYYAHNFYTLLFETYSSTFEDWAKMLIIWDPSYLGNY